MRRKHLFPVLGFLLFCAVTEAAIPLNSLQTFDTLPDPSNWATRTNGWTTLSFTNAATMDAAVQTNDISTLTNVLPVSSGDGTAYVAQWNSAAKKIFTRPAGISYVSLLATVQNTSGKDLSSVAVVYDFGNPTSLPFSEDPGLNGWRAYYSLTGQPNSWSLIPEFTTAQTGSLAAVIIPGTLWPQNSLLYFLWTDDNGLPATDGSFSIDNFIVLESLPPPPPPSVSPPATNIVCGYTIRLAANVSGFGLGFQWFKDGQLMDPEMNPTATQRVLIITNAEASDAGQYQLSVANAAGGQFSAPVPVQVDCRGDPPFFVFAYNTPDDPKGIRVIVDQELCTDESVCGGDATVVFNWIVESMPSREVRWLDSVQVDGTNLQFTLAEPRAQGETFRIRPADDGSGNSAISEAFGTRMPLWYSITSAPALLFREGFNGYGGSRDTELRGAAPSSPQGGNETVRVDLEVSGAPSQGLLRFEDLFGNGPGQIPLGYSIHSATLSLTVADASFNTVNLHRMLAFWDEATATFDLLNAGVQADGVEAEVTADASFIPSVQPSAGPVELDVTRSVQAWAAGQVNHGWVLLPSGSDGFEFYSTESASPPALSVVFGPHVDPCSFGITQPAGSLVIYEGASFSLFVALDVQGLCPLLFQWMKDGVDIPGATNGPTYSVAAASVCDAGVYRLRVLSPALSITSNPTVVTIPADIVRPVLTRAFGSLDGTNITLTFSKVMNPTNAPNIAHYVLEPPLEVTDAVLSPDGRTVTLTTAPRSPLTSYTLRIQDVTDDRQACAGSIRNVISPNPSFVDLTGVTLVMPWATAGNWNYATNSQDANPNWKTGTFGPEWRVGQQFFGFEPTAAITNGLPIQPDPIKTPLQPNDTNVLGFGHSEIFVSQYFHRQFTFPAQESNTLFALSYYVDDGAIFYLDGVEIGRYQMPAGPVIFSTRSTGGNSEAVLRTLLFSASAGTHHLAVEVHQAGVSSSDVLFGLQISKVTVPSTLSIARDQGTNIVSWRADSVWGLTSSQTVNGNYVPVSGNLLRVFRLAATAQTNNTFYRLQYTP